MAVRSYLIEDIDFGPSLVRKPRQWLGFTLRRVDDGRRLYVKLRSVGQIGQTISLDDDQITVGLWKA